MSRLSCYIIAMARVEPALTELSDEPVGTPVYLRIANGIAAGIAAGRLSAGEQLPTHRSLAQQLGVAVPTVSRAYREAEQRGLINSTAGRGTFVTGIATLRTNGGDGSHAGRLDMAVNSPARGEHEQLLRSALTAAAAEPGLSSLLAYDSDVGGREHREAAADWISRAGVTASADGVVLCHGGQHAILVALGAVLRPGDVLLADALTYPGVKSAAQLLGLSVVGVQMDESGMVPAALAAACADATARPTAIYLMPNAHNPTAITMPGVRRHEIVELARRFDLQIIEDDVFGLLSEAADQPPALITLAPERTLYLTSLSKTLTPGLRWGAIAARTEMIDRLGAVVRASIFNPAPIAVDITRRWLRDGTADRLLAWQRAEMKRRFATALPILESCSAVRSGRAAGLHIWLELAEPWTSTEIIAVATTLDIDISSTSFFFADSSTAAQPIARGARLCIGAARGRVELADAVTRLTQALDRGPTWSSGTRV